MNDSSSNAFDPATERGLHNPRIIDLIALDAETNRVVFSIIEKRNWNEQSEQIDQFSEKLNNYLDYVLDGYFVQQYPAYAQKPITIKLECRNEPIGVFCDMFAATKRYLNSIGWEFQVEVLKNK